MCEFYAWFERALAARRAHHRTDDRRAAERRARQAARLRRPELLHHRRLQRQRRACRTTAPRATSHATIEGDGLLLIDSGGAVPGRHHRHHARVADRPRQRTRSGATTRWCSRARWPCRARASRAARCRRCSTRSRARRCGQQGLDYRPRHRPRRGLLPQRARRPADHQPGGARAAHGDGARHDHLDRARRVPARPLGRAHREPGAQRAGGHARGAAPSARCSAFETLTLCPIDTRCIDRWLLRADEIDWLDAYHAHGARAPVAAGQRRCAAPGCWSALSRWPAADAMVAGASCAIGVDLGGTKIEAIVLDGTGHELWRERVGVAARRLRRARCRPLPRWWRAPNGGRRRRVHHRRRHPGQPDANAA